jgi:2Fe-2S ferredoxin
MPQVHVTSRDGSSSTVEVKNGMSLMENLKAAGNTEVLALCGGCASCGTCHVYVAAEWVDRLPAMGEDEEEMLSLAPQRQDNSRLSCQLQVSDAFDGLAVTVAPEG